MSTQVHVMMDFAMPTSGASEEILEGVMDSIFVEDAISESLSDAGFFSNREAGTIHIDLMASGSNVDEAAAIGIAGIMTAMQKAGAADWAWLATVVTPPEQLARLTLEPIAV